MKSLMRNTNGMADLLKDAYKEPALVPASPWLKNQKPAKPGVANVGDQRTILLLTGAADTRLFVIRTFATNAWTTRIMPAVLNGLAAVDYGFDPPPGPIVVTTVDRFGNESAPTGWGP